MSKEVESSSQRDERDVKRNKKDVARLVALRSGMSIVKSEEVIEHVFHVISDILKMEGSVAISKFGFFDTRVKQGKKARNPKTGEQVWVKSHRIPFFRPAISLKNEIR